MTNKQAAAVKPREIRIEEPGADLPTVGDAAEDIAAAFAEFGGTPNTETGDFDADSNTGTYPAADSSKAGDAAQTGDANSPTNSPTDSGPTPQVSTGDPEIDKLLGITATPTQPEGTPAEKPSAHSRDLSDIDPEHRDFFRQTSNQAYNYFKQLYAEAAEHKARVDKLESLPAGFHLMHESNATHTPQYQELQRNLQGIQDLEAAALAQLEKLESGEPARDIVQNEQGVYVLGKELDPAVGANKIRMHQIIMQTGQQRGKIEQAMTGFKALYGQEVQKYGQVFDSSFTNMFKDVELDPAKVQSELANVPEQFRDLPEARFAAKAAAAVKDFIAINLKLVDYIKKNIPTPATAQGIQQMSSQNSGAGVPKDSIDSAIEYLDLQMKGPLA